MGAFLDNFFDYMPLFMIVFFIGFAFLIIFLSFLATKAQRKKLQMISQSLGLTYEDALGSNDLQQSHYYPNGAQTQNFFKQLNALSQPWRIFGDWLGRRIEISMVVRGTSKSRTYYTTFRAHFHQPLSMGLSLTREGFWAKVGKAITSSQDIELGYPEFDPKVIVKGNDEHQVKGFLANPSTRLSVLDFLSIYPGGYIDDQGFYCELVGILTKEQKYRELLDQIMNWVKILDF